MHSIHYSMYGCYTLIKFKETRKYKHVLGINVTIYRFPIHTYHIPTCKKLRNPFKDNHTNTLVYLNTRIIFTTNWI